MTICLISTTTTSQAVNDSDIAFMGMWSYVAASTGNAMHISDSEGDRAEIAFLGKWSVSSSTSCARPLVCRRLCNHNLRAHLLVFWKFHSDP